jgi:Ca-activated chloride channel homolog
MRRALHAMRPWVLVFCFLALLIAGCGDSPRPTQPQATRESAPNTTRDVDAVALADDSGSAAKETPPADNAPALPHPAAPAIDPSAHHERLATVTAQGESGKSASGPAAAGGAQFGLQGRAALASASPNGEFDRSAGASGGRPGDGEGAGQGGDRFDTINENRFLLVKDSPLSTFSIDVDTASYAKIRQYLKENHTLPPRDSVRIEEMVNYFDYDYAQPEGEHPFAVHVASAECPWKPEHKLVRIGLKGKEIARDERPVSNLVFLIDTSGSMMQPNKLPLVQRGLEMLADQLGENDRVSMVVYAGSAGLVLPATSGDDRPAIREALGRLQAGGSTNGGAGIHLAYDTARENFVKGGVNRVILCSDGDFNVGVTSNSELVQLAETNAKSGVHLTVLGFGIGNHNDSMLEEISNKANGNYYFIDSENEARKVLVDQMTGTLTTIAKDVKLQLEFNPARVASYRLIGYENRVLADRDFNDDKKDAGDIGAGHTVTALYEIKPVTAGSDEIDLNDSEVDDLKYQTPRDAAPGAKSDELLTVKLRYKQPDADTSTLLSAPLKDEPRRFSEAPADMQFAGAVAMFGLLLRGSEHAGGANYGAVLEIATASLGDDKQGYRGEFVELVKQARALKGE